jgi:ubiquinone/menaquinone biosynthesis C-methylase UbiE
MFNGLTEVQIDHVQTPYDRRFAGPLARLTANRLGWFVVIRGTRLDAKSAAIEQWTADPCESSAVDGDPGSKRYIEALLRERTDHAPWLAEALAYDETDGLRVLDVGCGQGIDLARYARAGARVTGVDLTPRHVELARSHLSALGVDADVVVGDAEALPFPDATFARVSSNGVLHHTPNMPAALREIVRVLEPGGQARVIVYNRNSLHYWLQQVLLEGIVGRGLLEERSMEGVLSRGVERSSIGARPLVRVYSPRKVRRLMRQAGFNEVRTVVRHLRPEDSFLTDSVRRYLRPRTLDALGRVAGWYVIGQGTRPG